MSGALPPVSHWLEISLLTGAVAAVLQLDRKEVGQGIVSSPVVCAPLLGLVLMCPVVGLSVGLALGLLWVADPARGVRHPGNDTLAALVAVSAASLNGGGAPAIGLVLLLAAPLAALGQVLDGRREQWNVSLAAAALAGAERCVTSPLRRAVLWGLVRAAAPAAVLGFLGTAGCAHLTHQLLLFELPSWVHRGLVMAAVALPALGVGVVLAAFPGRGAVVAFGGAAVVFGAGLALVGGVG